LRQISDPIHPSQSMIKLLMHVYTKQGLGGLFLGLSPRIAKVSPACAIMISCYEVGKIYFSN
jgi:solute carrier family 25 protein 39/40